MVQNIYQQNLGASKLGPKTLFSSAITNGAGKQVRYFSGTDAEIYFGDIFIDEVVGIQYAVQQNTMPLFGYNSYVFDDVAVGTRMVSGSFTINFTKSSFLLEVLETLKSIITSNVQTVNSEDEGTSLALDRSSNVGLNSNNPGTISRQAPLWGRSFDLVISCGNARQTSPVANSTTIVVSNVVLNSCQLQLSASGEPIYESYTFIGQDLGLTPKLPNETAVAEATAVTKDTDIFTIKSASYNEEIFDKTSVLGSVSISFDTSVVVKRISIEPKLELDKDRGLHPIQVSSGNSGSVSYGFPEAWRTAIKKHVLDGNTSSFPMTMVVIYEVNGKETTRPGEEISVDIQEVYEDM